MRFKVLAIIATIVTNVQRMISVSVVTAALVIYFTCLRLPVSGRPTESSSRSPTSATSKVADTHSPTTGLESRDGSEEFKFESNEYPDHYDYDNSDSSNLSEESSELEANSASRHNLSQLNNNTLDEGSSHYAGGQFSGLRNRTDEQFDQGFLASKRNSGSSYRVANTLQEAAANSVPPARSADVGSDNADDASRTSPDSEGSEESAGIRPDDTENAPDKREDVHISEPACLGVEINDTTDGTGGMLHVGEESHNGQLAANQIQPCGRNVQTNNHEQPEWSQHNADADSTPHRGEVVFIPHNSQIDEASTVDHAHPVVIDGPDLVDLQHTLSTDTSGSSENPGMLDESGGNTSNPNSNLNSNPNSNLNSNPNSNPNSNDAESITSNVVISEGGSNSSRSSRLNIHVPGNENVPADGILPATGSNSDKSQVVPSVIDQHIIDQPVIDQPGTDQPDTHNVPNGPVVKPNESSNRDHPPQSAILPLQSMATATSQEDVSPSTPSVHLPVSSRYVTLSESALAPSSSNVILQTSYNSNSRLRNDVNVNPNTLATSRSTISLYFTETLLPQTIFTGLSSSEAITERTMMTTTTPLQSSGLLFPIYTEDYNIQIMKTPLYQPAMTRFQSSDQSTIVKLNTIDEDIDNGLKVNPDQTHKIGTTLTTPGVFTAQPGMVASSTSLGHEVNSVPEVTTHTTKISASSNLLSPSSPASQILTSIVATTTSTIVATATAAHIQEDTVMTTSTSTQEIPSLGTSSISALPMTPGAVTSMVTAERETIPGNTTSSDATEAESPSSFMELKFGMSWPDFCQNEVSIRGELVEIMQEGDELVELMPDQLQLMNREKQECYKVEFSEEAEEISVRMYLLNKSRHFDRSLTLVGAKILVSGLSVGESSVIKNKLLAVSIHDEDNETPATGATIQRADDADDATNPFSDPGVGIAVALASVGGCYCLGLVVLQVIVRRRSSTRMFSLGLSRSYSATSSDSIQLSSVNKSRPNSGLFNPGLDITDSLEPSNPLTFIQLATISVDEKKIYEEYQKIPSRMPRMSVVPAGDEDKNRYANVLPLVNTRVRLHHDGYEPRSSYINANYITGPKNHSQYYIATQAPTDQTTSDFWAMVWQQGCGAIVMLTQLVEDGQVKCASYWPELVGKSAAQRHGDFLVELKQKDVHQEYIASKLEINNLREIATREIDHFWYTCWPAVGVPEPISLVKLVLDTRPKYESSNSPLVVHCSPGTGRTCTFIALDLCMRQFEDRRVVDVMRTVYVMRQERAGAIQNKEQYTLIYNCLNEYATIVVSPAISAASSATTLHALLSS